MITNLKIARIFPHPNNPRKGLGELAELSDSIKSQGILQNLTVIPEDIDLYKKMISSKRGYKGNYIVIIGHRRLSAARLAGLDVVPCVISEMDEKTQFATMLLENIQRTDLTIYEQGQGFQLLLDIGETETSIAEMTGFSKTTVKRRVSLLKLNQDELKKAEARGGTLDDYAKLDKIKDDKKRDELLKRIGTNNFDWELKQAISKQERVESFAKLAKKLSAFATEIDNDDKYDYERVKSFYSYDVSTFEKPDDAGETEYYFVVDDYSITLYKEKTDVDSDTEEIPSVADLKREKDREQRDELDKLGKQAYELRLAFIKNFTQAKVKKYSSVITKFAVKMIVLADESYMNTNILAKTFADLLCAKISEEEGEGLWDSTVSQIEAAPEYALLVTIYCALDNDRQDYHGWGEYAENEDLDMIYELLESLGYQMSDEEIVLQNGTHELYKKDTK